MKKVLVLGSSGMLGHIVMLRLEELGYSVFGISKTKAFGEKSMLLDIFLQSELGVFLEENNFDIIINCVALLVSQSEEHKDTAVYLNSFIPHFLETKYMNTDTKIIHVSTDSVFSGDNSPYYENSSYNSCHFYGRSKQLGEIINDKDLTVRSAFWGPDINISSKNFLNWILNQHGVVNGFTNHIFNGVSSLEFANFLNIAMCNDIKGVFHLTAKKPISKYDFILLVKEFFSLDIDLIPVETQIINRTLVNSRENSCYNEVDYEVMLRECLDWIRKRHQLYLHYNVASNKEVKNEL